MPGVSIVDRGPEPIGALRDRATEYVAMAFPHSSRDTSSATPLITDSVQAVFANQRAWLIRLATGTGAVPPAPKNAPAIAIQPRVWHAGDVWASHTRRVGVMLVDPTPDRPPSSIAIDRALAWLGGTGSGDVLIWSARPDGIRDRQLLARGAADSFAPHWMQRDLQRPVPSIVPPARMDLSLATSIDLSDMLATRGIPYVEEEQIRLILAMASVPSAQRDILVVVARESALLRRSRIVGWAIVNITGQGRDRIAGLYNLGVHPDARQRGIGTALTLHALAVAREHGALRMGLNATPEGERVYRKLGFRSLGFGQTWLMPAARLRHRPNAALVIQAEALAQGNLRGLDPALAAIGLMPNGETPVVFAARFDQRESVRWLLDQGATPEIVPLWTVGLRDEATALMANGRALNRVAGQRGTTPLHDAIERDDVELARRLIAAGADITARDRQYHGTPLDWARTLNRPEIAALLHAQP